MNSEEKTRITVDIYGTQYKLMGNSSANYMKTVAAHVHEHMHAIAKGHPRLDTTRIAVLAAVNMADEFFKQRQHWERSEQHIETDRLRKDYENLTVKHNLLQQNHQSSLNELDEHKRNEARLTEDCHRLQQELAKAEAERSAKLESLEAVSGENHEIHEQYRKLQEEYKKLQSEFNEWIHLAERED